MKKLLILIAITTSLQSLAQPVQKVLNDRNPGNAFALSFLLPGAGEMYNNQVGLGLAIFGTEAVLFTSGIILGSPRYDQASHDTGKQVLVFGGLIYLAQLIYAPLYSQRWNKKHGFEVSDLQLKTDGKSIGLCMSF